MIILLSIIAWLIILGLVWWLVSFLPVPAPLNNIISGLFIVAAVVVVLGSFGVIPVHVPAIINIRF